MASYGDVGYGSVVYGTQVYATGRLGKFGQGKQRQRSLRHAKHRSGMGDHNLAVQVSDGFFLLLSVAAGFDPLHCHQWGTV